MRNSSTAELAQKARRFFEDVHGEITDLQIIPFRRDAYRIEFRTTTDDGSYVGFFTHEDIEELVNTLPPSGEGGNGEGGK